MQVSYTSTVWGDTVFEISADKFGNYTITVQGKVIKRVTSLQNYLGKPRFGSKKLEENAIEDAKRAIEAMSTARG